MLKRILPIITLIVLALPIASANVKPPSAHSSIVGGQDASIADWPSISFILAAWDQDGDGELESASECTGTVIDPSWIISAAHCLFRPDGEPVDALIALTGATDKTGASRSSRPAIKLASAGGPYVTVEDLPNAAGWGTIDEDSEIGTDVLKGGLPPAAVRRHLRRDRRTADRVRQEHGRAVPVGPDQLRAADRARPEAVLAQGTGVLLVDSPASCRGSRSPWPRRPSRPPIRGRR